MPFFNKDENVQPRPSKLLNGNNDTISQPEFGPIIVAPTNLTFKRLIDQTSAYEQFYQTVITEKTNAWSKRSKQSLTTGNQSWNQIVSVNSNPSTKKTEILDSDSRIEPIV